MRKVLIANRGEIAVRICRACRDAGLASVAVYADPDREAPHVRLADEAVVLHGDTPLTTYLDGEKLLGAAARVGADAIHPGYGFLSENAEFAEAVIAAGLTWIGPPPRAIRMLGDKIAARAIAREVGAPQVAGSPGPLAGAEDAVAFARQHGLPIAVKAAFGGGGRGLKVARTLEEIPGLYESAVREAVGAFGHGECFTERYLDRPRHVETQCLADSHGNVVVLSTRDCSLQRRHQKLVEEAPAPFLTGAQEEELRAASAAILRAAGYIGAGTCEFLVAAGGEISFLEVNTRLQVEHPVTEQVTGIDLVLEMFRVADGQELGYDAPEPRGHAFEFRINCEDPGRSFLPVPGKIIRFEPPSGPGVRLDSGVEAGTVIGPSWDSLLAKLIVTGADRGQALARARRALAEFTVTGLPTTIPFHRAVINDPAFVTEPFRVHTRWIETDYINTIPLFADTTDGGGAEPAARRALTVEVDGRRVEVSVPGLLPSLSAAPDSSAAAGASGRMRRERRPVPLRPAAAYDSPALVSPMQGTVVKVVAAEGQPVVQGDLVVVLEAMKMEQNVTAHRSGTVRELAVQAGSACAAGTVICEIQPAET
jgi:acetyl-CoA/propionyl-CoA carboxylase, biotin carboxylase, biotin carboxyl carrier protein